jgi:hypothetical protein
VRVALILATWLALAPPRLVLTTNVRVAVGFLDHLEVRPRISPRHGDAALSLGLACEGETMASVSFPLNGEGSAPVQPPWKVQSLGPCEYEVFGVLHNESGDERAVSVTVIVKGESK